MKKIMEKTIYGIFLDSIRDKYFQNKTDSKLVLQSLNRIGPSPNNKDPVIYMHNPVFNSKTILSMNCLDDYVEISNEKVKKLIELHNCNKELLPYWTSRTIPEIVNSKYEDLNFYERILQRHLGENPAITLDEATDLLKMLP